MKVGWLQDNRQQDPLVAANLVPKLTWLDLEGASPKGVWSARLTCLSHTCTAVVPHIQPTST